MTGFPGFTPFKGFTCVVISGTVSPLSRATRTLDRDPGNLTKDIAMGFMTGKRALIAGLASNRSIAWGIAQAMHREGAALAFSYPNEKLGARVGKLAAECGSDIVLPCDVGSDEQIGSLFTALAEHWDGLDIIVHSVAFAPSDQLAGDYLDCVTRDGFRIAHDISSYSFAALAKAGRPLMQGRKGALLTLSYLGAVQTIPNYNVMGLAKASLEANVRYLAQSLGREGIRVNGISAGPIRTLAAAGISNFRKLLDTFAATAPLGRNVTIEDVGNAAAFLCSDLASGITGEITYVDGGYNTVGMAPLE
jgi:enoyl-[acyl-carrier protein] reductase I